jgi:uncharacterized protein
MIQEKPRYIHDCVSKDLDKKMVFVAGPRQVGKTTFARKLLSDDKGYLNWDIPPHRDAILRREYPPVPLIVFDEIHKYRNWRNYLKGFYDQFGKTKKILVTGSARLDYYRYGGDSLQGRYHFHRLFPFTVKELNIASPADFSDLVRYGGFPEPFLSGSETESRRWSREYRHLLINEEIISLENVTDTGAMQLLATRLPDLVGSPLSINSLREDLQVAHKTVSRWIDIFERMYMIFRLAPFRSPSIRAVKKEQKHYFFDWNTIEDPGSRFENVAALHLYKWVCFKQDTEGLDYGLTYFRDSDGREVDFVVTDRNKPLMLVEAKSSDREISKSLKYLKRKFFEAAAYQISAGGTKDFISKDGIRVMPAVVFLQTLV